MRNLIVCLILSCIVGCATNRYYVREDGRQTVIVDEGSPFDTDRVAYVTDYEELRALPHRGHLMYVGTKDGYHIVRWWEKISPGPSAVFTFAVPKDQFAPAQPFKFEGFPGRQSQSLFDL
jgi:hypothetical protein